VTSRYSSLFPYHLIYSFSESSMKGDGGRASRRISYNLNLPLSPLPGEKFRDDSPSPSFDKEKYSGPDLRSSDKDTRSSSEVSEKGSGLSFKPAPKPTPVIVGRSTKFWTWFSPYRQLLFLVVTVQALMILVTLITGWNFARTHISELACGNMLVAITIRSEWVMRLIYWTSIKFFRNWAPLKLKVFVVGILYHIGGLHSGCGISAMMWLVISWAYHLLDRHLYHYLVLASLFLSMIVAFLICVLATPLVRGLHHNVFEITHRFLGWLGIITSLIFVLTSSWWDVDAQSWRTSGKHLMWQKDFWLMIAIIPLIVGQWITVRNVPVTVQSPSGKASIIRVPGGLTSGLHTRISRGGLREWHIFGSISEGKQADCHYIVMAVQGGFTGAMNKDQPETLYTKTWKPCGLPYFSRLFNRGVAICTGSGIGAVGSTCIQHDDWFLIWIGGDLEKTYGLDFMNFITSKIPAHRLLIWDTKGPLGRPDVNIELENVYKQWDAQIALFIGSPALNKSVLRTSRARGIPVFGSIWDA